MTKIFRSIATYVALAAGLAGVLVVLYAWQLPPFYTSRVMTNDAYVRGQVTMISPQLAGYVVDVPVQDYQRVKKGDLLVKIDDQIYAQKLAQAEAALATQKAALEQSEQDRRSAEARVDSAKAQLEAAQAALQTATSTWKRNQTLLDKGVVTSADAEQARNALSQAQAGVHQAEAALEVAQQDLFSTAASRQSLTAAMQGAQAAVQLARIDLQNTAILAPRDGTLGEVGARPGQYISPGAQLASLVPARTWVVANFKETQLEGMRAGQPVTFTVDALGDAELSGHIERFAPATGSEFSVLKADNATGNFTKIAQRLPVRIAVDDGQPLAERLVPGMSVVVSVDIAAKGDPLATATASNDRGDTPSHQ